MKHSLSAFAVITGALLCFAAFARYCPAEEPEKGLRRIDLSAWEPAEVDTAAMKTFLPPVVVPEADARDTSSHRILFVGDSMAGGLRHRMSQYATANGHTMEVVAWYSSSSKYWAKTDTLSAFIRKFKPTYIFLCIGSNELFVRNIAERMPPSVI